MDNQFSQNAGARPGDKAGQERHAALIVSANSSSLAMIQEVLAQDGWLSHSEPNPIQAMELLRETPFRLVLCDWNTEYMTGAEFCKRVRSLQQSHTHFAILAQPGDSFDEAEILEQGVDDILHLPLTEQKFRSRLKVIGRIFESESKFQKVSDRLHVAISNLEIASRRFEELFHGLPVPCFTVSAEGTIQEWNRECEEAFDIEAPFAFLHPIESVLGDASQGFWSAEFIEHIIDTKEAESCQWSYYRAGRMRFFAGRMYPFLGHDGSVAGVICANIEITDSVNAQRQIEAQMVQLEEMNKKLEILSITDGLTGIRNRRSFQDTLEEQLRNIESTGQPVSLFIMDVDHFKKYNDSFGHVAGDGVLKTVARILKEMVVDANVPARYGGEEFVAVLPGMTREEAVSFTETVRAAIESVPWVERQVTGSFGVATTMNPAMTVREFVEAADEALYSSKETGRNRVTHIDSIERNVPAAVPA